jgi:hypothetical protein
VADSDLDPLLEVKLCDLGQVLERLFARKQLPVDLPGGEARYLLLLTVQRTEIHLPYLREKSECEIRGPQQKSEAPSAQRVVLQFGVWIGTGVWVCGCVGVWVCGCVSVGWDAATFGCFR